MRQVEDFEEFAARMACPFVRLPQPTGLRGWHSQGKVLFRNGASSDGGFVHTDPPRDPCALLQAKRAFLEAALEQEQAAARAYRARCLEQASLHKRFPDSCPPPPASSVRVLKDAQTRIEALLADLAGVDALLDELPGNTTGRSARQVADQIGREQARKAEEVERGLTEINL